MSAVRTLFMAYGHLAVSEDHHLATKRASGDVELKEFVEQVLESNLAIKKELDRIKGDKG